MEQEKMNNSDTSSAESDHHKPNINRGRSYECTFCKRGFTNAQALGGHMNIHRKDKAKTKAKAKAKARRKNRVEDPLIQNFDSSFSPQIAAAGYGQILGEQVYMTPPNHGLQTGNYEFCFFPVWRPDNLQDRMDGGNLSMRSDDDEDQVDLELRLGRLL